MDWFFMFCKYFNLVLYNSGSEYINNPIGGVFDFV